MTEQKYPQSAEPNEFRYFSFAWLIEITAGLTAGAENPKPWVVELVYVLINHRYEHMLPTIITTNYDGTKIGAVFGKRIQSRLAEMTVPVNIRAEDYRMRGVTA